jgi:regulator of protease activity HflC (stomatin/prohibitin superfamily)
MIVLAAVGAIALVVGLSGVRIAQEYQRAVAFRLGRYQSIRGPGLYYLIPFVEWARTVDTRTATVAIEQQETITKDSVTVKINAVLWYRVTEIMTRSPLALELRRMQMFAEVGAENNTTTIAMMPSEFMTIAKGLAESATRGGSQ